MPKLGSLKACPHQRGYGYLHLSQHLANITAPLAERGAARSVLSLAFIYNTLSCHVEISYETIFSYTNA